MHTIIPSASRLARRKRLTICGALALVVACISGTAAHAATIQVNSNSSTVSNDGYCTLPEAVTSVNTRARSGSASGECAAGDGSSDVITLMTSRQTYSLSTSLVINRSVTINGLGLATVRSTAQRIFEIADASSTEAGPSVTMVYLTIENGSTSNTVYGIYFAGGTSGPSLVLSHVVIRNCTNGVRAFGGAYDSITVMETRIEGSKSDGFYCNACYANILRSVITGSAGPGLRNRSLEAAGQWPTSRVILTDSVIENNGSTSGNGGGIVTDASGSATVELHRCAVTGNRGANGGGIYNRGSLLILDATTISGNTAARGAGIYIDPEAGNFPGENNFSYTTISRNTASQRGGGIYVAGRQPMLVSTIVQGNTDNGSGTKSPDCFGNVSIDAEPEDASNIIGDATGCTAVANGIWYLVGDAKLGPLVPSGRRSGVAEPKVHIPLKGSPAINVVDLGSATGFDGRGLYRPEVTVNSNGTLSRGTRWDIGAVEYHEVLSNTQLSVAASSGDGINNNDTNGYFRYSANATNDYVTFAVPVSESGTYSVTGHVGKARDGGTYALEVASSLGGTYTSVMSQDLYSNTTTPSKSAMTSGSVTFSSSGFVAGLRYFRFRVTGKNASATGYLLRLSYLKVAKN